MLADNYVYTLPSEAEWENAARGLSRRIYPWGNDTPDLEHANYAQVHNSTTPVGCFTRGKTPEGILDLAGNVWEWTRSEYGPYPYDTKNDRVKLESPLSGSVSLRGGSWVYEKNFLQSYQRNNIMPTFQDDHIGFRLVRYRKSN
jgi:formylglycine-generating enzyme required for sulfatase activity